MPTPPRIGCSGWNYASWRRTFYPQGLPPSRWLEHYSRVFDTVEVNTTFYRLAKRDSVARWVEQTPDDFMFAVKASRYLTHMKRLTDMGRGVERLYEPLEPLVQSGKLGPVLWQLGPNFRRDDERLARALDCLPPGRHTFEFRDHSWYVPDVYALLRERGVALTVPHRAGSNWPRDVITTDWTFVRFHYGERGRRGNYSKTEIADWAVHLADWVRSELEVFAYFNNDWETFAPPNARELRRRLQALVDVPVAA
ncbi:MAG TPA: DUF72 domain-containing protein [Solirubrobacteraceae bacterium]|nr:DUF72 domain-containing protein [Solirubrobacteraceae bacterium]